MVPFMTNAGRWTRDELESAFEHYQTTVVKAGETGDWNLFADLFTEDATYNEHVYGRFTNREEIRAWIVETMTTFPGSCMPWFPVNWYLIDEENGRIVCEILNRMQDPGDGSIHESPNITILTYAGDNQFSHEEDVYNPANFIPMIAEWSRVADRHETLPHAGVAWLDAVIPDWRTPVVAR